MSRRFDGSVTAERAMGLGEAVSAVCRGEIVVLPTDTVHGPGVDAFSPRAVARLLDAKGRGRNMPPPVRSIMTAVPQRRRTRPGRGVTGRSS